MQQLYDRGPFTVGVFRMAPNISQARHLREKLDAGEDPGEQPIHVAASALKVGHTATVFYWFGSCLGSV